MLFLGQGKSGVSLFCFASWVSHASVSVSVCLSPGSAHVASLILSPLCVLLWLGRTRRYDNWVGVMAYIWMFSGKINCNSYFIYYRELQCIPRASHGKETPILPMANQLKYDK